MEDRLRQRCSAGSHISVAVPCVDVFIDEEPSPRSPFGEYNTRSNSGFDANLFARGPSACLTYRIPCDGQPGSLSSSGRLGESVKSLSPLGPAGASSLVGKQTVDEYTAGPSGRSAGEHVGSTVVPAGGDRFEACCAFGGLGALAGAGNSGVAVRASRLQAVRRFEESPVSEGTTERSLVLSANLNTIGHASGPDISAIDQARSAAVISNGSPVLKLSPALGVESAAVGETKVGPSEGAEGSSDGDQQPGVRRVSSRQEDDGLLHPGLLAEGEARTRGSRAASVSSGSLLADSPSAQSPGPGLCVSGQVSSPAGIDCGADGPGELQNAGRVRKNEAEEKADGEGESGIQRGAESELEQEERKDTPADGQQGKAEDLWMVNEGQSYCLVSSATHSEEEDSERTQGRLIVSRDVRSEVQRLQRALDQLKSETTVSD